MKYLLFILLSVIVVLLILDVIAKRKKKKLLLQLREAWGKESEVVRDIENISVLSTLLGKKRKADRLLADLDLEKVYGKIDRCHTRIGQQVLFDLLISPFDETGYQQRQQLTLFFEKNPEDREKIQLWLNGIRTSYHIPHLFLTRITPFIIPLWYYFLAVAPLILFIGSFYFPILRFGIALSFAVNLYIHYSNKKNIRTYLNPVLEIITMTKGAARIAAVAKAAGGDNIKKASHELSELNKFNFILASEMSSMGDLAAIGWTVLEYIKITFLIEVLTLQRCSQVLSGLSSSVRILYYYIGEIDVSVSAASFRSSVAFFSEPVFTKDPANALLEITSAVHPLLEDCVPNDIHLNGKGMVITGSNMSGKTSYIKTIAVNVLLAQSIGTALCKSYRGSIFQLSSSVKSEDDIAESTSYYLAEVLAIKELIGALGDEGVCHLFIVDELFKGTNTVERIAAARAVLLHLQRPGSVILVSTHDLELAGELAGNYELFHFTDAIEGGDLLFDHRIKAGPLKSRNAIRLLEMMKYPAEVVKSAEDYVNNPQKPSKYS